MTFVVDSDMMIVMMREPEYIESEEERKHTALYGFPVREIDNRKTKRAKVVDIKRLWSIHKEIVQLDSLGYKGSEIAKMMGLAASTVSNCLNSTLGKEVQLAIREERDIEYAEMRKAVTELTWKSLEIYEQILEDESENNKLKKDVADTVVLELAGMRAPIKTQSISAHAVLTSEELAEFKRRGFEAARASGKLVEITEERGE